jgi:hypothetical protein
MNNKLIYLASPYSDDDIRVEEERYELAVKYTAKFMNLGYYIFSPIVHCHNCAVKYKLPTDWNYWRGYCELMVPKCEELWILQLKGWEKSKGIKGEVGLAEKLGLFIKNILVKENYD